MRNTIVIALLIFIGFGLKAQDPHFSQYYNTPMHLNPALTGVFNGKYRFGVGYREQWTALLGPNSFKTMLASFDVKYRFGKTDFFAFGVNMLRDEVGDGRLSHTIGNLNMSYMMQVSGSKYSSTKQFLVAGLQAGMGQNTLNWSRLWFGRQFDVQNLEINDITTSGESIGDGSDLNSNLFLDLGLGLMWYVVLDEHNSVYGGLSLNHLNNPNISLLGGTSDPLYRKMTIHGGGELSLSPEWSILPSIALMFQGPSFQANFGSNFRYTKKDWKEVALRVGSYLRVAKTIDGYHTDAIIMSTMLEFGRFVLGLSYDVTSSDLSRVNSRRGAFETTLLYVAPMGERRQQIICPNF